MTMENPFALPLGQLISLDMFPLDKFDVPEGLEKLLMRVYVVEYEETPLPNGKKMDIGLSVVEEAVLAMPGLDGIKLVFGGLGAAAFKISIELGSGKWAITLAAGARLRFSRELLHPVLEKNGRWVDDPSQKYTELILSAGMIIDQDWDVSFDGTNEFSLAPSMIGDTDFVIEGTLAIDLSDTQSLPETLSMGLGNTWRGTVFKSLTLHIPHDIDVPLLPNALKLTNFHIGSGGISGQISGQWAPQLSQDKKSFAGDGAGKIYGIPFALKEIDLEFKQNTLIKSKIQGAMIFPFFDQPAIVDIGLSTDGDFTIALSADQIALQTLLPPDELPQKNAEGLFVFTKKDLMKLTVTGIGFEYQDGKFLINVSGSIQPLLRSKGNPPLNWPEFDVKSLSIDSDGKVKIDGGWVNLPNQKSFSLYGFSANFTQIGFGNETDGSRWIGLSGGIKLVDGLPLEGGVEGLKIIWKSPTDIRLAISGIRVSFEIKNVMKFDGTAVFIDEPNKWGFKGGMKIVLYPLNSCSLDVQLMVGKNTLALPYTFFYIYINAELPFGIPLFATGLSLYGMAGLFGYNIEPNKGKPPYDENETWYENPDGSPGWYLRGTPGITDAKTKWVDNYESMAFGAGITLGTAPDNGFAFSAKTLIVFLIPGPVIIVEGKANFLKERKGLDENPLFRVLAIYDNRVGTFLMNIEANYWLPEKRARNEEIPEKEAQNAGKILKIRSLAEAFFNFNDPTEWHLYIGQKPKEKRLRAEILSLFEANAYFMIDNNGLAMGAWIGFDERWNFSPLTVTLQAWIAGDVTVFFKPPQVAGELALQGSVSLSAFGVSVGISASALLKVQTPNPFLVYGEFYVKLDLPWPLPDPSARIPLEWKEETETKPPIPMPLAKFGVEHLKVTEKWTIEKYPKYDANGDGFCDDEYQTPSWDEKQEALAVQKSPVVPLDSKPVIIFGKSVEDIALIGDDPISVPDETVGNYTFKYSLTKVKLEKKSKQGNGNWVSVGIKSQNKDENIDKQHLFNWYDVPKNNSEIINFLKQDYGANWVEIAKIEKIDSNSAIKISDQNSNKNILLRYNEKNNRVTLILDDGRTYEFVAELKNGKLNIYSEPFFGKWQAVSEGEQVNTKLMLWSKTAFSISRELESNEIWHGNTRKFWTPCRVYQPKSKRIDFENEVPETILPVVFKKDGTIFSGKSASKIIDYVAPWADTTKALKFITEIKKLIIKPISGRTIPKETLWYTTTKQAMQFKVAEIKNRTVEYGMNADLSSSVSTGAGYYAVVGWIGEKYVAINGKNNKLAKLVLEQADADKKTLAIGETWDLGDGYTLTAQSIDAKASPRQAWLVLSRDGNKLDDKIIDAASIAGTGTQGVYTYYAKSIAGETNVPIFVTYVDNVFASATSDMVQLKYTWLISNTIMELKPGDKIGIFKVDSISGPLTLKNDSSITLSRGSTVDLVGSMKFKVADSENLRFYPVLLRHYPVNPDWSEEYEVRGEVYDPSSSIIPLTGSDEGWDTFNFAGFWFDLDKGLQGETLKLSIKVMVIIEDEDKFKVSLPEPSAKIDIFFGKGTQVKVDVLDEGLQPAGSKDVNIPLSAQDMDLKPVTFEGNIKELLLTGSGLILKICYIPSREIRKVAKSKELKKYIKEATELHWNEHKENIFEPDTCYRLTVETEVKRNGEPFPFIEHTYFRTEKPPGVYPVGNATSEHYPTEGPLKDLSSYVSRTIPKVGEKPVYCSYDIGLIFNEQYVEQMYLMANLPLLIQLFDNNNQPITDIDGNPVILENHWGDNPQIFITREEEQWINLINEHGCAELDYTNKPKTRNLYSSLKNAILKPETIYRAKVIAGKDKDPYTVYQFSFITSKYATFIHQTHSFQDIVWSHNELLGSGNPLLSANDKSKLENILTDINPGNSYQPEAESKKFEQINELFRLGIRQLPGSLEPV